MKSQALAVIELPATASSYAGKPTRDLDTTGIRPYRVELEAFPVRLAWAFALAILFLMVVSLLLAVADYAGSTFTSDSQPKTVMPSRVK